ncbi:MAG: heparinase II/III family protein [Candidatus Bathyarchaeia archaeon]
MKEKLKYCDEALEKAIPQLPRSLYDDFFRTGRRHPFEGPYFHRRRMAEDLALAYILTGRSKYLDRCRDYIWEIMEEFTWILPAHVRLPLRPDTITLIDLFSSGTAMLLADLWDLLHDDLDNETLEWMRYKILDYVLIPLRDYYDEQWWAKGYRSNWCGVCCGNSGCALILTALDEGWSIDLLRKLLLSIDGFLETADPDGAWVEGVGYWFYGFSRVVYLADLLAKITDGRLDLLEDERIKATATFPVWAYLPPRSQVNFGDTGSRPSVYPDLLKRFVNHYRDPAIAWYIERLKEENLFGGGSLRDLLLAPSDVPPSPPVQTSKWYRRIGVIVTRSSWVDMDAPVLAVKAGHNAEPHNHIDVGQFIYHCYGNSFIRDLGVGIYDRDYFSSKRYENPICGAEGHNLIFVDGKSQAPGEEFEGKIVDYHRVVDWERIKLDLTKAYPSEVLSEAIRTLLFFKLDGLAMIDEVKCQENASVESRLHFKGDAHLTPGGIDICAQNGRVYVEPKGASIKVQIGTHKGLRTYDRETVDAQYIRLLTRATEGYAEIQAYIVPYRTKQELETRLKKVKSPPF